MRYLAEKDYLHLIRKEIKNVVIPETLSEAQLDAEIAAEQEIDSYLNVSYDTEKIFLKHTTWDPTVEYLFNELVILLADDYVEAVTTYVVDDLVSFTHSVDGLGIYICIINTVAGEDPEDTPASWTKIDAPNSFFTALKTADFVLGTIYEVGEFVVYEVDNVKIRYIVTVETTGIELPTDTDFWAVDSSTIAAGVLPITANTDWTKGDTRFPLINRYMVDITLYELHSRINPRNIPEHRIQRRDDAIKYLMAVNDPRKNIRPDFPLKTFADKTGTVVVWGSNDKINHGNNIY